MRILVTGANGYLGHGIVKQLIELGNNVIATDIKDDHIDKRAEVIKCDLFEVDEPFELFNKPDAVFHLAWRNGFVHNADSHLQDLAAHYRFLDKLIKAGIEKVAVMGSMHEIGFYEGSIDENTICAPLNLYGVAKDALRKAVQFTAAQNGTLFQWVRAFYIVGNSKYGNSVFSKIVAAAHNGEKSFPFTSGQNQYDFMDYDDFCRAAAAIVSQNRINGIVNCCSGKPVRLGERVERFIKENGYDISLAYGAFPDREYDSLALWGNDKKLKIIKSFFE